MTKEQFKARALIILNTSKKNHASSKEIIDGRAWKDVISGLAEHDPELSRLVVEADTALLEPLQKVITYLSRKFDH
jgi:hypothetical protein